MSTSTGVNFFKDFKSVLNLALTFERSGTGSGLTLLRRLGTIGPTLFLRLGMTGSGLTLLRRLGTMGPTLLRRLDTGSTLFFFPKIPAKNPGFLFSRTLLNLT